MAGQRADTPRHSLIACEHCASVYRWHSLDPGEKAACERCDATLWRYSRLTLSSWLALAITGFTLFVVANAYPVAALSVQGMTREATLLDAVGITWRQGHYAVAIMTGAVGFLIPLLQLFGLLWVLGPLSRASLPVGFRRVVRGLGLLRPWSMVPVFLLGVVVSAVKLASMAVVEPRIGLLALACLTVLLTMLSRLSTPEIWRLAERAGVVPVHIPSMDADTVLADCHVCGQVQALNAGFDGHCCRCDAVLHYRKPETLARTWALLLAAAILYIPANVLPVMQISSITGDSSHTILGGVVELWEMGSWDIAMIVFIASIAVPLTKLLSLAFLALTLQWRSTTNLRQRTRLYQMVEFIGQWSMLDVFVVIILAALADFPGLMAISAGAGATSFGLVVVLTMLSAMSFDLRCAWDLEQQAEWPAAQPDAALSASKS
ncbi:paraquat-inducible protein A [Bordetella avium]|uniref:Paraquat-inducible protein A n=1 Tax=Bordetella avium (strain 197N) TaxID=360910 RepID=Q2KZI8_BORA1|nr:PqiA/YebS family transporter subunit [Bordetella avium]AZY49404.1 paraquat-inducible protein A [Bordetella avium]AZY52757.1 paraquat-inducible protein A [Bordetella avium]RIQ12099.1 PqiA/YebS family transporter subunit [Bordetella avium]RIQ19082.1 PqiA/YebS family transporter subunit [Bordetella avium]RIQ31992.1 PqiA/YebS family transporter subunit [Bordetella avium]